MDSAGSVYGIGRSDWALVNTVINIRVPHNAGNFLSV